MISQPLYYHKFVCSRICNNEIAGARRNMNIKVAVYDMTYLQDYTRVWDIIAKIV